MKASLRAIMYSLDTFIPFIDVTGAREWGWTVARGYHWVVVAERLLGLLISLLAAYSLRRNLPLSKD